MEITSEKQDGGWIELRVTGRLDNYWADHFKTALDELIRGGQHKIRLHLAGVSYLSSAGVGALVRCHKQLESIRGKLIVANPSTAVQEVLELTRLTLMLATEMAGRPGAMAAPVAHGRGVRLSDVNFEVFGQPAGPGLTCRLIGAPTLFAGRRFGSGDCRAMRIPATALGVGLGALGSDYVD